MPIEAVDRRDDVRERSVSPLLFAGAAGWALASANGRSRGVRTVARVAASALMLAAFAPLARRRLIAAGARRRRVRLRTELVVDLPVRQLFAFCHDFENFPRVIQSLSRVIDYQDGRSRWEVVAPGGRMISWDCVVTKYVPNVVIAWETVPGSSVEFCGTLRFIAIDGVATRLQVEIQFDPVQTELGQALRAIIDVPRERQLRADIERAAFHLRSLPAPEVGDTIDQDAPAKTS